MPNACNLHGNLVKVPRPIYGRVCVGQRLLPTMLELSNKARIVHVSTVRANMATRLACLGLPTIVYSVQGYSMGSLQIIKRIA